MGTKEEEKQKLRQRCPYLTVCKDAENCNPSICLRFLEMDELLRYSDIPEGLRGINKLVPDKKDIPAFDRLTEIKHNIADFVNRGDCLYIYSTNCGNGKTVWTVKILMEYFNKIWENNLFHPRGMFVDVAYYLMLSKEFEDKQTMKQIAKLRNAIPSLDLVVFDDITSVKLSSFDGNILFPLINRRMLNGKAMIFSGNVEPTQLEPYVGNKLKSRICSGITIEIKGEDRRVRAV